MDIRELDAENLLASENQGDTVVAILTRLGSEPYAAKRVLKRLATEPSEARHEAVDELSIIAGLRKLGGEVKRETSKMPIQEDIRDHDYFGPPIRQAQIEILTMQIGKRFGVIPPQIRERLSSLSPGQIDAVSLRVLDANRIEDHFAQ